MIYLNKEHDTNEKYIIYDNILTPLVAFLNNVLSYQEKRRSMKEYGFNVIDKEVEKMCNLGEMIEREAIQKTKQSERKKRNIMVVKNLIHNLNTTFSNAVELLGLPQQEIDEIKKYFQS